MFATTAERHVNRVPFSYFAVAFLYFFAQCGATGDRSTTTHGRVLRGRCERFYGRIMHQL